MIEIFILCCIIAIAFIVLIVIDCLYMKKQIKTLIQQNIELCEFLEKKDKIINDLKGHKK
jgi:hypothetical protein